MKYTLEMDTRETLALFDLLKTALVYRTGASVPLEDEDEDLDVDTDGADHFVPDDTEIEDAPEAPPVAAAPAAAPRPLMPEEFATDKNARLVVPSPIRALPADHPLVIAGRKAYFAFVDVWQRNLGVEDAEQPDRVDLMRSAAAGSAGPILAYLRFRGGLVAGTLEFLADSAGNVSPEDQKRAVEIATNIAQVGSVLAPEFTDMMEFVKPDGTVIPHVRYEQVRIPQE